jgi:hypothetical protein
MLSVPRRLPEEWDCRLESALRRLPEESDCRLAAVRID